MKIAFAMINCNRRDGSARPVNEVAERLAARGHEIHLYARLAEDLDLTNIHWHKIPGPGWPDVADFWTYHHLTNRAISRENFDIIHSIGCNTVHANVITIQNIQPAKERAVHGFSQTQRVSIPRQFTRKLHSTVTTAAERNIYTVRPGKTLPLFLPVSRGVEAELREHYNIGDAPVRIIPNAADVSVFRPVSRSERKTWREQNAITESDFVAIFCGGEWARKGLEPALQGIARCQNPAVKLFVAGDDPDRVRYQTLASSLGISHRVVFGGFRRDVALALAACDVFLFPSHYEAFSLATIEAAACGLPILATKINGTEDFIRPGVTGEFVSRDPQAIADALAGLANDPTKCSKMGSNARELVKADYTWDRVAEMTEAAYKWHLANPTQSPAQSVCWFTTKGSGTNESERVTALISRMPHRTELPFDKGAKLSSLLSLWQDVGARRPSLLVMEGTGIAGGAVCLLARALFGIRYVVSSGDAVGPFFAARHWSLGLVFGLYERILCRFATGFIGWTPYLVGRALAFGTARAVTAPGWPLGGTSTTTVPDWASDSELIVGIIGNLEWLPQKQWCYGMDLVRAARRLKRRDLRVVIVGNGSGLPALKTAAGNDLGRNIFIPGPVPLHEVVGTMSAFNVASLPQSVDGVGSYRYTTKLSEYAAAGLPVITNQIPMAYDLGTGWMWRLPGNAPWHDDYLDALVALLESLTPQSVTEKRARIPQLESVFDRDSQIERVTDFLQDILSDLRHASTKS